mgnify:CR=1 FL=1
MKLSMKSRYGLRALIDLSVNSKNEQVALGGIAERNNISPQYLEQVFASLRKAGRSEERRVGKECRSRWSQYH